jgi:hypothetical protein
MTIPWGAFFIGLGSSMFGGGIVHVFTGGNLNFWISYSIVAVGIAIFGSHIYLTPDTKENIPKIHTGEKK